jgi:hypothetical protein
MPRTPINYTHTIIYKIVSTDNPQLFFIGHTTEFTKRKALHKTLAFKGTYKQLHQMIQDNGGWDKFKMLQASKFPCEDKNEADSEVFRVQCEIKMELLNRQFDAHEAKIKAGERKQVKPLLY